MIEIKIKLFGIFEELFGNEIKLNIKKGTNLTDLKVYLINNFFNKDVKFLEATFKKSMFSDDSTILSENYILENKKTIYLLPPFSGG